MKFDKMINQVIQGDCLEIMKDIPDNSIDLVLTDPPYNIGKDFANDNLTIDEYDKWCIKWIKEINRILKWGGAIYITLGWQCVSDIKIMFSNYDGLRLKNWIIWYRQDGWKGDKGFAQTHEHILYYLKDLNNHPNKELFAQDLLQKRKQKKLSTLQARKLLGMKVYKNCGNAGKLWFETGRLPNRNQYDGLIKNLNIFNYLGNFIDWRFNKIDNGEDVWIDIKSEKNRIGHPTQKPIPLMERIIMVSSDENDIILDPFLGSGTTAVAAQNLNRRFIGIEISKEYCEIARQRLRQQTLL